MVNPEQIELHFAPAMDLTFFGHAVSRHSLYALRA